MLFRLELHRVLPFDAPLLALVTFGLLQSVRNEEDLECLACPPKYRAMQDFYKFVHVCT